MIVASKEAQNNSQSSRHIPGTCDNLAENVRNWLRIGSLRRHQPGTAKAGGIGKLTHEQPLPINRIVTHWL